MNSLLLVLQEMWELDNLIMKSSGKLLLRGKNLTKFYKVSTPVVGHKAVSYIVIKT